MARRRKSKENLLVELVLSVLILVFGSLYYVIKVLAEGLIVYFTEVGKNLKEIAEQEKYERQHQLEEQEEQALAQELSNAYNNAVSRLRTLIGYTENKLYYEVVKTEFPGEGRIREFVNFLTYDKQTVAVENANQLVNTVLNNVLGVYKGKSTRLHDTIVLDDYACDMKDISRTIAEKIGVDEIKMVMS
jgi:hypothetical protein